MKRSDTKVVWAIVVIVLLLTAFWVKSWSWQEPKCSGRNLCTPAYMDQGKGNR